MKPTWALVAFVAIAISIMRDFTNDIGAVFTTTITWKTIIGGWILLTVAFLCGYIHRAMGEKP
jgi:uncharacterized membrane protein